MSVLNPGVLVCPQKESGQATAPLSQRIRPGGVQLRRQQRKKRKEKKRGGSQQAESTTGDQGKKLMEEENLGRRRIKLGRISLTEMSPTSTPWHIFVRTQSKKSDRGNG